MRDIAFRDFQSRTVGGAVHRKALVVHRDEARISAVGRLEAAAEADAREDTLFVVRLIEVVHGERRSCRR